MLSIVTCRTVTAPAAVSVAGSSAPPKRSRITPVVEKPSRLFNAVVTDGYSEAAKGIFKVPAVEPKKYRSVGYGNSPAATWNKAVLLAGCVGGVEPPGLPWKPVRLAWPVTVPLPPVHPLKRNAPETIAAAMSFFISLELLTVLIRARGTAAVFPGE